MRFIGILAAVILLGASSAQAETTLAAKKTKAEEVNLTIKVNEIIKTQDTILKQLDEIRKELEIVKIRATR